MSTGGDTQGPEASSMSLAEELVPVDYDRQLMNLKEGSSTVSDVPILLPFERRPTCGVMGSRMITSPQDPTARPLMAGAAGLRGGRGWTGELPEPGHGGCVGDGSSLPGDEWGTLSLRVS